MATKINIKNLPTGYQSIITNGKHTIIGDEPIKSKGTDLGLAPGELVLAGLAMCKVATVRYIARQKKWDIRDVDAQLEQTVKREENGKLSTHVQVALKIEGDITEEQKHELLKQADNCYIHRMINGDWDIESAVEMEESTVETQ
ncbi:OsmC family protein [Xanthovirga aplysinae]|uniref:OsmC family protein n=1 Tax=Xanthovirga aplysinae TaxID=2529853 RepID=UPI0012BD2470|nr:OsmC family protein [Xanthovirga aplysinae]MTI29940.1 OsmC family peroxiredoxin [Xanthovirga aplysinae]